MNYILEYYQCICNGSVIVGKWIKLWYEYLIKGLQDKRFFFDAKKANKAILFCESFCRHHEGALAPQLIKLELWQKALLSVLFGILDDEGNRQFRETVVIIGRKNGKTLFAAAVSAYMAYMDGEYGARIYMCAPKLQQAALCFEGCYQMIMKEPELSTLAKKRRSDIYIESSNTTITPLAFNAKKSDGLNPSLVVCDEIAAWQGDAGLKQYEVLKSALGARRQPLLLSISTAGYVNDGVYDELLKRSTSVILGNSKETRLAPFLYMIDHPSKWNDINELAKANPNLGVSISVDYLLEEIAVAENSLSKRGEMLCKYANIKQNSSQAWIESAVIDAAFSDEPINLEDFRDSYAVCGLDLSCTTDLTAATVVIEKNEELYVFAHFWMPAGRMEILQAEDGMPYDIYRQQGFLSLSGENYIDYHDVYAWFCSLVENYSIYPLQTGYDRYSAKYLIEDMKAYGFHCDDVYQGWNLTPVIYEFDGLIRDGKIHCGNNNLLKAHFYGSALKQNGEGQRRQLVKISKRNHIDGMAALLDAFTVRQKWYADIGEQLKN